MGKSILELIDEAEDEGQGSVDDVSDSDDGKDPEEGGLEEAEVASEEADDEEESVDGDADVPEELEDSEDSDEGDDEVGEGEKEEEGDEKDEESGKEAEPEVFILKVNGEEIVQTREEVIALAQKGLDSGKKYQEAKQARDESMLIYENVMKYPMESQRQILMANGWTEDQVENQQFAYMEKIFSAMLEEKAASPEKRIQMRAAKENEELRRRNEQLEQERLALQKEREALDAYEVLTKEIDDAMTETGLKGEEAAVAIAKKIQDAELAEEDLTASEAAHIVKREFSKRKSSGIPDLTLEELRTEYPEVYKKLVSERQKELSTTQPMRRIPRKKGPTKPAQRRSKATKPINFSDLLPE